MTWYHWLALSALTVCIISCLFHLLRLIKLGAPKDLAKPKADAGPAISYSFTGAMSPSKKESAYLHLPTYTAGILFHIGTFLALFIFLLLTAKVEIPETIALLCGSFLVVSCFCGFAMLIKRIIKKELLLLSNADDFISNLLVSFFQLFTVLVLFQNGCEITYFIIATALFLYLPVGKLRHVVYFFAARYHLGLFYGKRGVWPSK